MQAIMAFAIKPLAKKFDDDLEDEETRHTPMLSVVGVAHTLMWQVSIPRAVARPSNHCCGGSSICACFSFACVFGDSIVLYRDRGALQVS